MTSIKWGIYVRISEDRGGEGLGVRRQELECRELAKRLGGIIVEVYCDNDISAFGNKKRKDFERMLADIRAGRINGIIAQAPDRLYRKTRALVALIDFVNEHNTAIQTVRGGQIDLSTAIGRMNAKTIGNIAEFESEIKSERIHSKIAELVRDGKIHNGGPRPFGFRRIYAGEGDRRRIVRDEINEAEADLIREAARRVLAGESVYEVVGDFNARGIRTSTGRAWSSRGMKIMLTSGRIAGLKEHHRQVVGKASWSAIISREDHEALRARLNEQWRFEKTRGPVRKYWLSGMVFCSDCMISMGISTRAGTRQLMYKCPPPKQGGCGRTVKYQELSDMLAELVITRLNDPDFLRDLAAREADTREESRALVEKIEADQRRLKLLQAQLEGEDDEELPELVASVRTIRRRIGQRRDRLATLAGAEPLAGIDVAELAARWKHLSPEQKAGLLRVAKVARVLIDATKLRGRFDPDRVNLVPVSLG